MSRRSDAFSCGPSDLTLASVRFACPAPAGHSQSPSLGVNATSPCKTIDNGQLGQGRAEQSKAEWSRHVFWTTVTLSQYGHQRQLRLGSTFSFRDGYPAHFRLAHEKTSNPIEYFRSGWARSGKDHASPAVVPSFLYPVTLLDMDASNCIYLTREHIVFD